MEQTKNQLQISVSNNSFVDNGDGVISFPNGLTITDDSVMRSGTRYDINTLDVSNYAGQVTADHVDSLSTLIGKATGVIKEGNRVAIQGIKYAVNQNPYARLAYDLLVGGFSNSFSIETMGPWPGEDDRTYHNHELVGLSQVVVPNNYNAKINQFNEIVHNSLERSQQDGLDTEGIEELILNKAVQSALPLAPMDQTWDNGEARKRVKAWASDSKGNLDEKKYSKAFFWYDSSAPDPNGDGLPDRQGDYKLLFADIVNGELKAVWNGVVACMGALNGARAGLNVPDADRKPIYRAISSYYKRFKKPVPALNSYDEMIVEEESMAKDKKVNTSEEKETPVIENEIEHTEVVETETPVKVNPETPAESPEAPAEDEKVEVENEPDANVHDASGTVTQDDTEEEDVADDTDESETEESQSDEQEAPAKTETEEPVKNQTNKNKENLEMTKEEIAEIVASSVAAALKPVQDELKEAKETAQNALDAQAKEPEFTKHEEAPVKNAYDEMEADELFSKQLNAAVSAERLQSVEARQTLNEINGRNLNALKEAKIVNAATTLEDLGNFVIAPELFTEIVGVRTPYNVLLDATNWRETQSLEFAWLSRTADIDMQPVAIGAHGDVPTPDTSDSRLKPISQTAYTTSVDKLEEMAAVTPISINVIKFAAADILADVAEGYRHDYDKKRAQLVIARLQQAVNASGQKYTFDISDGLVGWAQIASNISDATTVGTLIMNNKTLTLLKGQALQNYNASILADLGNGTILGLPFIVVPNDLLPTLNTSETKSFTVNGASVTIDQAVFYGDLRTFTGRSSGGLKYDVDGSASYEVDGTVYSAYQRNEIVLRGSFFRGGVVRNPKVIASIPATAVS